MEKLMKNQAASTSKEEVQNQNESFFFQAEDGIRDDLVTGVRRVLFRSYIVEFPAGTLGGAVWIFDPIFCPTGRRTSTPFQHLGMGEAWYSIAGTRQVTTEFKLWNMEGTPYSTADDVLMATDGGLLANMASVDR